MRHIKHSTVGKKDSESGEGQLSQSILDFAEHRSGRGLRCRTRSALPRPARNFDHLDDRGCIETLGAPQFVIPVKKRVQARSGMHFAGARDRKFPAIVHPNHEWLEWLPSLTLVEFLQHSGSVESAASGSKGFF